MNKPENTISSGIGENGQSGVAEEIIDIRNPEVNIRAGVENDFPQVLGLIKELALYEKAPFEVTNSVERMVSEKDNFYLFVAESQGSLIGYALCFTAYSTWKGRFLYLDDVYVQEKFQRKKIGDQLLQKVFRLAQELDVDRLRWQVIDWNKGAIKKYESMGADISSEWLNCTFDREGIQSFLKR